MRNFPLKNSQIQFIKNTNDVELSILREDVLHPTISGNKFRKLKYNLKEFSQGNYEAILTFGGAFSNHISAVAAAGKEFGIKTIGIIRGEELNHKLDENPTLRLAKENGMHLKFVNREIYRNKEIPNFIQELRNEFGSFYLLPEGGTNHLAVKGCMEILTSQTNNYNYICVAAGTGGTASGIIESSHSNQRILVFPALQSADFLKEEIKKYSQRSNWKLIQSYHFGGYGKTCEKLILYINSFKKQFGVPLDPVYTGKLVWGIEDLISQNYFPAGSKVLAIHTGGLQGIEGMNERLKQKNKTILE